MIESAFWGACLGHLIGYLIAEAIRFYIRNKKNRKITCKDCKYNNGGRCTWHNSLTYSWIVDDGDYCSCAVRREEE